MAEVRRLEAALADPDLHRRDRSVLAEAAQRLAETRHTLTRAEERWLDLEAKREAVERKEGTS